MSAPSDRLSTNPGALKPAANDTVCFLHLYLAYQDTRPAVVNGGHR